jgi:Fe-S-cluster containining protein
MTASKEDAIRELFATETEAARSVLSESRDRNTAVKLAFRTAHRAERTFLPVLSTVACKPGCSFCCRGVPVDVTAPEALTIARGFRETLSKEHIAVILRRVKAHARAIRSMTLAELRRARTPCPMLDEASNLCAVHDARPMRCRAHHSLDAAACEAACLHPEENRGIPRYPDVMNAYEAMILGQRRALAAAKVDLRSFELSLALEVALEVEDASERWAKGERLFDAAVFEWPDAEPAPESDVAGILLGDAARGRHE